VLELVSGDTRIRALGINQLAGGTIPELFEKLRSLRSDQVEALNQALLQRESEAAIRWQKKTKSAIAHHSHGFRYYWNLLVTRLAHSFDTRRLGGKYSWYRREGSDDLRAIADAMRLWEEGAAGREEQWRNLTSRVDEFSSSVKRAERDVATWGTIAQGTRHRVEEAGFLSEQVD
jgi:hypothetical protein